MSTEKEKSVSPSAPGHHVRSPEERERDRADSKKLGQDLVDNLNRNVSQGHQDPKVESAGRFVPAHYEPTPEERARARQAAKLMAQELVDNLNRNVARDHPEPKVESANPSEPARWGNSPEDLARRDRARAISKQLGQALVDNLNRNVLKEQSTSNSDARSLKPQQGPALDKLQILNVISPEAAKAGNQDRVRQLSKANINPYKAPNTKPAYIPEGKAWRGWIWIGIFGLILAVVLRGVWMSFRGPT